MEDIEYRVDVYDVQAGYEKTRWFEDLEEAGECLRAYSDKKRGYFATISIETYKE